MSTREYQPLEINAGETVCVATFTANDEYLVSGSEQGIQVWRVADGKHVVAMPVAGGVTSVAASRDGRWIAGGSYEGGVLVWDAATYKEVFTDRVRSTSTWGVDFSPDSTHLVSANDAKGTATIWDIEARRRLRTLRHEREVLTAKYSPQADRIATATDESVRVWDSNDGRLLVCVKVQVSGFRSLLWCNNRLLVETEENTIVHIDASTGSILSEWSVPNPSSSSYPCIALPQHRKFVVCAAKNAITFWDPSADSPFSLVPHTHDIYSIACSSDGQLLAIASKGRLNVKHLSSVVFPFILEPELHIEDAALHAWKHGQLTSVEASLSAVILTSENKHHALASRALVRARLGQSDAALLDAEESIGIQRSLVGYVARCVAFVGQGKKDKAIRTCDITFQHFHSEYVTLLLLIKAVVLFMAGEHVDAMSRIDDLITDAGAYPELYMVQAQMYLLRGNMHMESGDYKCAIHSFENARIKLGNRTRQPPLIVSLISGWHFDDLAVTIQQHLCVAPFAAGRAIDAAESVLRMADQKISMTEPAETWLSDFKYRCRSKLEVLGDNAFNAEQYDDAALQYIAALLLDPPSSQNLFTKLSKAYAEKGDWRSALTDANEVIKLDPSSPLGYERKYAALLGMGHQADAIRAFETMLSKMSESSDPAIRERSRHYIRPEHTKEAVRTSIKNAIRDTPLVLINTISGRLCNKSEQAAAFESTSAFTSLITSTTTHIDQTLIEQVVGKFYRYATFSHTWEGSEPLYDDVVKIVVYDLDEFPTHKKLQMFCKVVRDEGFTWAWSDTCCIDKGDHFVLQEALVSMFKWYKESTMTIIFLYDVDELAEIGALIMSRWNSRGWTLQEYLASKVVRFYTKDWTPYLGLTIYNHKESPEIISEMEKATGISTQALMALRPGLSDIREKLCLASTRQTTRVEDAAYSLLGIFSMTLPVTYGEGDMALGRLLSQLLASSGDTSILAWTGRPNSFNSCLPTNNVVFSQPLASHIPSPIADAEMGAIVAELHASSLDLNLITRLYDRVDELPTPTFAGQRMRLPCLAFRIRLVSGCQDGTELVFRAKAGALGDVEIRTRQNLAPLKSLYLVHPWVDFLLDRRAAGSVTEGASHEPGDFTSFHSLSDFASVSDIDPLDSPSLLSPSTVPLTDAQKRTYQFLARLRQPFGALLLAPIRQNVAEYRRIATESLITAQVKVTSATLEKLIQGVRVLDVL